MSFIESLRSRRENYAPKPVIDPQAAIVARQEARLADTVVEDAHKTASRIVTFFTKKQGLKIRPDAKFHLTHFVFEAETTVPSDDESPQATKLIKAKAHEEDIKHDKTIEDVVDRTHPNERYKLAKAYRSLRSAAQIMDHAFNRWDELSFPDREEAKERTQRYINRYTKLVNPEQYDATNAGRVVLAFAALTGAIVSAKVVDSINEDMAPEGAHTQPAAAPTPQPSETSMPFYPIAQREYANVWRIGAAVNRLKPYVQELESKGPIPHELTVGVFDQPIAFVTDENKILNIEDTPEESREFKGFHLTNTEFTAQDYLTKRGKAGREIWLFIRYQTPEAEARNGWVLAESPHRKAAKPLLPVALESLIESSVKTSLHKPATPPEG